MLTKEVEELLKGLASSQADDATVGRAFRAVMGVTQTSAAAAAVPVGRDFVSVKFTPEGGRPTNVCVPRALYDKAVVSLGAEKDVRAKIRELAKKAPETLNRSGWIQDELLGLLQTKNESHQ